MPGDFSIQCYNCGERINFERLFFTAGNNYFDQIAICEKCIKKYVDKLDTWDDVRTMLEGIVSEGRLSSYILRFADPLYKVKYIDEQIKNHEDEKLNIDKKIEELKMERKRYE